MSAGFEVLARELIAITRAEPATADPDREIVDGWADKLDLSRWYGWKTPWWKARRSQSKKSS